MCMLCAHVMCVCMCVYLCVLVCVYVFMSTLLHLFVCASYTGMCIVYWFCTMYTTAFIKCWFACWSVGGWVANNYGVTCAYKWCGIMYILFEHWRQAQNGSNHVQQNATEQFKQATLSLVVAYAYPFPPPPPPPPPPPTFHPRTVCII